MIVPDVTTRAVWVALVLAVVGCSSAERLWPAAGRVTFTDGRPVAGGVIECRPATGSGPAARGAIDAEGGFTLATAGRDGVRAGRYRAVVLPPVIIGHAAHGAGVAARFGRFESSGLEIEVPPGGAADLAVVVDEAR